MTRSETVLASVAPFVSLAQTRTFTYALVGPRTDGHDVSQVLASSPVLLESLVLDLREPPRDDALDYKAVLHTLLTSFNPQHFHVLAQPVSYARIIYYLFLPSHQLAWSQLRKVRFTHSLFNNGSPADCPSLVGRSPPLDLVYDVSTKAAEYDDLEQTLFEILADLVQPSNRVVDHPVFGHVQVWVNDQDEVARAQKRLVGCSCTLLEIGVRSTH